MTESIRWTGSAAPELTFLVPVHEQEAFAAEAVASVLAQQGPTIEVIVSDDASTDATWDRVAAVVRAYRGPHRVLALRQPDRRRRDHLALLADLAGTDLLVVAHGDDRSRPGRAAALLTAFDDPDVSLVASASVAIGEDGRPLPRGGSADDRDDPTAAADVGAGRRARGATPGPADLLGPDPRFVGAVLAWRRSALAPFPPLDARYAAAGHDAVLPFRAALAGTVAVLPDALVERRRHRASWGQAIWDKRSPEAAAFGRALYLGFAYDAMARDLDVAERAGLVPPAAVTPIREALGEAERANRRRQVAAAAELTAAGRTPVWLSAAEVQAANEGTLAALLERRARLARAVRRAGTTVQRVTGRRR